MVSHKTTVRLIFTISKYVGLFPYSSSGPLPKLHRIISLIVNLVQFLLALSVLYVDLFENKIYFKSDVFRFSRRVIGKIAFSLGLVCHVLWQTRHPNDIPRCLRKIHNISTFLGSRGFTCYNIPIILFGLFTSTVLPLSFGIFKRIGAFDFITGFMIPLCGNILFLGQFYAFMEVFRTLFVDLNKHTLLAKDLYVCTRIHAELCDLVKIVNKVFFMPLLMAFVSWLISLLTQSFQIFQILKTGELDGGFLVTLPVFFISQTLQMWSLCHIAHEVCYESEAFSDTLCCSIRMKYPPDYNRKLVMYLVIRPSVRITAFHLFDIDTSILATILGTVVTYFIVLVQLYS